MWKPRRYAVLLCDCHMPNMDGFELTAAIRELEMDNAIRSPIVAITANALEGESERCIAAGMDDYLSKPLDMGKLRRILRKWIAHNRQDRSVIDSPTSRSATSTTPVSTAVQAATPNDHDANNSSVDLSFLIECFGNDQAVHRDILQEFASTTPSYAADFGSAISARETTAVVSLAHTLKSAARSVGANDLADLCEGLERAGKARNWVRIDDLAPKIEPAVNKVAQFIARF